MGGGTLDSHDETNVGAPGFRGHDLIPYCDPMGRPVVLKVPVSWTFCGLHSSPLKGVGICWIWDFSCFFLFLLLRPPSLGGYLVAVWCWLL